jgi:hypothetical protein
VLRYHVPISRPRAGMDENGDACVPRPGRPISFSSASFYMFPLSTRMGTTTRQSPASAYVLPPQGVNASPLARVVVSRQGGVWCRGGLRRPRLLRCGIADRRVTDPFGCFRSIVTPDLLEAGVAWSGPTKRFASALPKTTRQSWCSRIPAFKPLCTYRHRSEPGGSGGRAASCFGDVGE